MRLALALAALAAAVVLLRRRIESNHQSITFDADDSEVGSEVVGMPTGYVLGFDKGNGNDHTVYVNWDAWFETARRQN